MVPNKNKVCLIQTKLGTKSTVPVPKQRFHLYNDISGSSSRVLAEAILASSSVAAMSLSSSPGSNLGAVLPHHHLRLTVLGQQHTATHLLLARHLIRHVQLVPQARELAGCLAQHLPKEVQQKIIYFWALLL